MDATNDLCRRRRLDGGVVRWTASIMEKEQEKNKRKKDKVVSWQKCYDAMMAKVLSYQKNSEY